MKFYGLEHAITKEAVGPYPQSERMADHYYYKGSNSIRNLNYDNHFIPDLDAIQLVRGAKLTDLLSVVVISPMEGKIISKEFKDLLGNFDLPKHAFYKARVINSKNQEVLEKQYFLFRVLEHQNQHINFDRSEFYIKEWGEGEVAAIDIHNAEDLEISSKERGLKAGQFVTPRFITLLPDVAFDIFSFRRFAGFFISERLKTAIEQSGLTGIRFEFAPFIIQQEIPSYNHL